VSTAGEQARAEGTPAASARTREDDRIATIEQLDGTPARAEAMTEEILREYLMWCGERLTTDHGVVFDDVDATAAAHHREFARELPQLLGHEGVSSSRVPVRRSSASAHSNPSTSRWPRSSACM
jgi:hypothetical protein